MKKQSILDEIKRTAEANGGKPLGRDRFRNETGIRESDWEGKYWARWSDALIDAGLVPNDWQMSYDEDFVIDKFIAAIQDSGRYPGDRELRMRRNGDPEFPSRKVFQRIGKKAEFAGKVIERCRARGGLDHVIVLCEPVAAGAKNSDVSESTDFEVGYVYLALMKVGREKRFKIGKADIVGRRTKQIAVQLPEDLELIHAISTDDAYGIESYWHKRFRDRRKESRASVQRSADTS